MELKILHLYPDLMNLYGSYGNVSILVRTLEAMGHQAAVERVLPGQAPDTLRGDVIFMGAGTERAQKAALAAITPFAQELRAAAADGAALLFVGGAMELLGERITDDAGKDHPGLGLGSFVSVQGKKRLAADVCGYTDLFPEAVAGFVNRCSRITGVETPLLRTMLLGIGNEGVRGPEGYHRDNVFASELTGPILIKNPALLRAVIAAVCRRRGAAAAPVPVDAYMTQGWETTVRRLLMRRR